MTSLLNKKDCENILNIYCKENQLKSPQTPNIRLLNYKITNYSDTIIGFLGSYYRLNLTFTINSGLVTEETFFIKCLPQTHQNKIDYVTGMGVFQKESLLYKNLLPQLLRIFAFGPRCYLIKPECIILEDLSSKKFKMATKCDYLNPEYCASALKSLAKFHATTLIFEEQKGFRLDEKYEEEIKEVCFSFSEDNPRKKWCDTVTQCVIDCIMLLPETLCKNPEDISRKLHDFVFNKVPDLMKPSKKYRNVLTHNDLWINNMLFDDDLNCVLVDFQLARYAPPAFDLLLTLYLNLERHYLEENFEKLVEYYFETLISELGKYKLENLISSLEFGESLQYFKLLALTEACMYGTTTFLSQEFSEELQSDFEQFQEFTLLNRSKYVVPEFRENWHFRNRFYTILLPLVEMLEMI